MKRFLFVCCLGFVGALVVAWGIPALRIALLQPAYDAQFRLPEGTKAVCIGDSRIGCTFAEVSALNNKVLWYSAAAPEITLMRLRNLVRLGELRPGMAVIAEFGPQSIAECQPKAWGHFVKEAWNANFSWAWRYPEVWGRFPRWFVFDYLLGEFPKWKTVTLGLPDRTVAGDQTSVVERPKEMRERNAREAIDEVWTPEALTAQVETRMFGAYKELRDYCATNGVRLILLTAPLSSDYRALLPEWGRDKWRAMQDWDRAEGFEYHDCTAALEDKWFLDAIHLSKAGAERFTRWFFETYVN